MSSSYVSSIKRKAVYERALGCCEYCQCVADFVPETLPIEHILPESKNGSNELDNLALSCHGCNGSKYDKTHGFDPTTENEVRLFHPRQDKWTKHFEWNEDFSEIIGLTPIGRATIITLKMNRPNVINLRFALYLIGYHPPKHTLE